MTYNNYDGVIKEMSRITGMEYSEEQLNILRHTGGMCILACAGSGKALKNDMGVLTPSGYIPIEKLAIGDICYDEDGKEQDIVGVYPQGKKQIYKVIFSDSSVVECCKDHLWTYKTYDKIETTGNWSANTLEYIMKNVPLAILDKGPSGEGQSKSNVYIPMSKPVQFQAKELNIHPYLLGCLLGGGELKFIPEIYKYSSIEDRDNILRGLINTIGNCSDTGYDIVSESERLIDDIKFIVETLGMVATKYEERATYNKGNCDDLLNSLRYRLHIIDSGDITNGCRNSCIYNKLDEGQYISGRAIKAIIKTKEYAEMTCIKVSGDSGLFLTENCVVTHNTTILTHLLAKRIKTGEISSTKRLLCTTFSRAGSSEMEERLGKLLRKLGISQKVQVKTLHGSYYNVLKHFGLIGNVCTNSQRLRFVVQSAREAGVNLSDEDLQTLDSLLSYQVNNLLSDDALIKSYVYTLEDLSLDKYSAIRYGYNKKKEEAGLIDFDDMQLYMYMLLVVEKRKDIIDFCRGLWTDFFIDEFQDTSRIQFEITRQLVTDPNKLIVIGDDDQCLVEGTTIKTTRGMVPIEEIRAGDSVLTGIGRGKTMYALVNNISRKRVTEDIVVVKTRTGKELRGTTDHIGFARLVPNPDYYYTYLMYKRDIGFRIGITSGVRSGSRGDIRNGIDMRLMQERSDKAWLLRKSNTKEDALYWESYYAYKYGIPMYRFVVNGEGSAKTALGIETIKALHSELDTFSKGLELLKDLGMHYKYPHRVPQADGERYKLNYSMFSSIQTGRYGIHKSELSANSSNEQFVSILRDYLSTTVRKASGKEYVYYNARNTGIDTDTQEDIIREIEEDCKRNNIYLEVNKDAKFNDNKYMFMPLGNLIEGMYVPILNEDKIEEDEIVKVTREKYEGYVYDISVPDTKNFVANGIVVHNCIYQWRGADPNIILDICGYYDIQRFVLSTNYRCGGEIVKRAAVGIKNNVRRSDKEMIPYNQGGIIKLCDTGNRDLYDISKYAYKHVINLVKRNGVRPSEIAILSRNNQRVSILNSMLFKAGVFCETVPEMRMTNIPIYKGIKNVISIAGYTYNKNIVSSALWQLCNYLGVKGSSEVAKFMDNTGLNILDALGYIINNYTHTKVEWDGNVKVPQKGDNQAKYYFGSLRIGVVDGLQTLFDVLSIKNEHERTLNLLDLYIAKTEFMYKSKDKTRTLTGLVNYFKDIIKNEGLEKTQSFMRLSEQYESGKSEVYSDKVVMSTIHGAKGKEWDNVIIFADDNITFPSFEGINKMLEDGVAMRDISGSIDEGRRLHYVAMTRARNNLTIFTDKENISVYALESLGFMDKGGYSDNKHIINIATNDSLPQELRNKYIDAIFSEGSQYYYTVNTKGVEV